MAETLSTLSLVAFILSGVLFVGAAVLFFVLKIPQVIDYFTNRSAKRSIRKMRTNETGGKSIVIQTDPTNKARGKLTQPIPQTEKKHESKHKPAAKDTERPETGLLNEAEGSTAYLDTTEELALDLAPATDLLDPDSTTVLEQTLTESALDRPRIELTMLDEVMLIHTEEVVP